MYTQALNSSDGEERISEDGAREAHFQARIDAEERSLDLVSGHDASGDEATPQIDRHGRTIPGKRQGWAGAACDDDTRRRRG